MKRFSAISFRHLLQNKMYAVINIIGLTAAITYMLLAVLYWKDERSFDSFHKNNPNLYRVITSIISKEGKRIITGGTGQVQGPAFKAAVPEIKNYARIFGGGFGNDFKAGNKILSLQPLFVDDNFFDVFSFHLVNGNPASVLNNINSVVVTESTAKKLFNTVDVTGKLLQMDADPSFEKLGKPLIISGVVKDPPKNSSLQFDILLTFKFLNLSFEDTNWLNAYLGTFVVLHPDADINSVLKKFQSIYNVHGKKQVTNNDFNIYGYDPKISYGLQPVTDIHLNPLERISGNEEGGIINGSDPVYSYIFMGIALFILLMAGINFINISIAGSLKRAKEVAVRKISGGSKWSIMLQFLNESAILCFIAFLLSLILMNISVPLFNSLTGRQLVLNEVLDVRLTVYFLLVLIVIILFTGIYPAYILSSFKPSEVLYNRQKLSGRSLLGRSLVVIQFAPALFLLITTIIYYRQMNFIHTKDLGYKPDHIIRTAVSGDRDYKSIIDFLRNELAKEPSVKIVTFGNDGWAKDMEANGRSFKAAFKNIDENFLATLEIPLKHGRNLSPSFQADIRDGAIVNEAFIKEAGIDDPIGKQIKIDRHYDSSIKIIRGVVKDFHVGSLREPVKPMLMYMSAVPDGGIWVKFEQSKQKEAMASLERIYKTAMPNSIYKYDFLDELNAREYLQEQRWQKVISIATALAFIVCCLGLFGLAHLSASQRIKEIGIRKILGASVSQVVALLSGNFLKLVMIAFIIAAPAAWLVMSKWLQNFAYRIDISWWIFLVAGILAAAIAFITVSIQSIKAALANPVNSLRTE